MVLVHEDLVPPDDVDKLSPKEFAEIKPEYDVITALGELGHEVRPLGVSTELTPIRRAILDWKPHIAFVLLEEFHGVATYDQHVVGYLELMRQPYTGCNPRGLILTHDKALCKKILTYHRIQTPRFAAFPRGRSARRPARLKFPLFVKSLTEDASLGIAQASIVHDDETLVERVRFIHEKVRSDAIAEEYIDGRELYVGVIGNRRLQVFPIWEMVFSKMPDGVPRIATAKVKWDPEYQKKHGITTRAAKGISKPTVERIHRICKRVYRALNMSGYARMDLRMTEDERIYVLEANANPNIEYGEDFAESAEKIGISYPQLIQRLVNLGLSYQAPWKEA